MTKSPSTPAVVCIALMLTGCDVGGIDYASVEGRRESFVRDCVRNGQEVTSCTAAAEQLIAQKAKP